MHVRLIGDSKLALRVWACMVVCLVHLYVSWWTGNLSWCPACISPNVSWDTLQLYTRTMILTNGGQCLLSMWYHLCWKVEADRNIRYSQTYVMLSKFFSIILGFGCHSLKCIRLMCTPPLQWINDEWLSNKIPNFIVYGATSMHVHIWDWWKMAMTNKFYCNLSKNIVRMYGLEISKESQQLLAHCLNHWWSFIVIIIFICQLPIIPKKV